MHFKTIYAIACISCSMFAVVSAGVVVPPESEGAEVSPLAAVDISAYAGTWYQAYGSRSVLTFELFGSCVRAIYSATDEDGVIGVRNSGVLLGQFAPTATFLPEVPIEGLARQSPDAQGQLQVGFGDIPYVSGALNNLVPAEAPYNDPGNYWVFEVGPIVNGQYDWALVTNGDDKRQLYILVRDIGTFEDLYEEDLVDKVRDVYGFTSFTNEPVKTNHDSCNYGE